MLYVFWNNEVYVIIEWKCIYNEDIYVYIWDLFIDKW